MMFFLGSILEFTAKMRGQANDQLWYSPYPGQVYSVARMLSFFEPSYSGSRSTQHLVSDFTGRSVSIIDKDLLCHSA